jgi:hypothetical protein
VTRKLSVAGQKTLAWSLIPLRQAHPLPAKRP